MAHPNTTEHHIRWITVFFAPTGDKALRTERRFWAAAACAAIVLAALFGLYQRAREGLGAKEARGDE